MACPSLVKARWRVWPWVKDPPGSCITYNSRVLDHKTLRNNIADKHLVQGNL